MDLLTKRVIFLPPVGVGLPAALLGVALVGVGLPRVGLPGVGLAMGVER